MPGPAIDRAGNAQRTKNVGGDFHLGHKFQVEFGNAKIVGVFKVEGFGDENESIRYADSQFSLNSTAFRPGLMKTQPVELTRYFSSDTTLMDLFNEGLKGHVKRDTLTITVLSDDNKPAWQIICQEAWLRGIEGPTFDARVAAHATETAEFVYETFDWKAA